MRTLVSALLACVAIVVFAPRTPAASQKSVFVAVVDQAGHPVKDMTAADFRLREDATEKEIMAVHPATAPLAVVLLVDTTQGAGRIIQDLRKAATAFVTEVHKNDAQAQVQIMEFGQADITVVPFTQSDPVLLRGIGTLTARAAPAVFLEALTSANEQLAKQSSPRRAIVSINLEPETESSKLDPKRLFESARQSGAELWAAAYGETVRGTAADTPTRQTNATQNSNRDGAVNKLAQLTGGIYDHLVAVDAIAPTLTGFADALASEYEIVYTRAGGSAKVVQVGTTRPNVTLHASGFAPQ